MNRGYFLTATEDIKRFVFAGNATFTMLNRDTGNRFTFKVTKVKGQRGMKSPTHFIALLNGPNNEADYIYLGQFYSGGAYQQGVKSKVGTGAPSARAFEWFAKRLQNGAALPPQFEFWHEGKCGRCGRKLTDPVSIERGIGPECWTHFC